MAENARISVGILSSQTKIFPDVPPGDYPSLQKTHCTLLDGEAVSFQLAMRTVCGSHQPVSVAVQSSLDVSVYKIGYVPLTSACNPNGEEGYERSVGGLFPDVLLARPAVPEIVRYPNAWGGVLYCEADTQATINCSADFTQGVWVTLNEDNAPLTAGEYPVCVTVTDLNDGMVLYSAVLSFTVIGVRLPRMSAYYTNWFHCDCLADLYGVEVYSERFWEIFRSFVANAAKHRMNTLLLPAFTPPLDIPVNGTRRNVQLVGIVRIGDGYRFDFERMRRYIRIARDCGILCFEHCHLFSQWGAEHAPLIYASVNGREEQIFGWDTDASGAEYRAFLASYLQAFAAFAREEGIWENMVFHVSDEPAAAQKAHYRAAVEGIRPHLQGCLIADALSDYSYYADLALRNQSRSTAVGAERGSIYDRNMNVLAYSCSVQTVYLDPHELKQSGADLQAISAFLAQTLNLDADWIQTQGKDTTKRYKQIAAGVDEDTAATIRSYINQHDISGIHLEPGTKRSYPYGQLASQVIGFTNASNTGCEGIEAAYNSFLEGENGVVITTKGNNEMDMPFSYEAYVGTGKGNDVILTLDHTVQACLEKRLQEAIARYDVQNGGCGLEMDVNTGEILAIATIGGYDPNTVPQRSNTRMRYSRPG